MNPEKDKHDLKMAFGVITCVAFGVVSLLAIIVASIAAFSWVTAGPADQARATFGTSCERQFAVAQYPPECVKFAQSGK